MKSFGTFLSSKARDNKDHLSILKDVFQKSGFDAIDFLSDHKQPYIYIRKPQILENVSFGGIRIYTIGTDIICFRVQNKEHTEPFGSAYQLDVKGMFKDMVKEDKNDIGEKIIDYLISEINQFFIQSAKAEQEMNSVPKTTYILPNAPTNWFNRSY